MEAHHRTGAAAIAVLGPDNDGHPIIAAFPPVLSGHPDRIKLFEMPAEGRPSPITISPAAICAAIAGRPDHATRIQGPTLYSDMQVVFYWTSSPRATQEDLAVCADAIWRQRPAWVEPAWRRTSVDALSAIIDKMPVALLFLDDGGAEVVANAAARELFGISATAPAPVVVAGLRTAGARFDFSADDTTDCPSGDLRIGDRRFAASALPVGRKGRSGVLWCFLDVTARRAAEQERAQAKRDAITAQVSGGVAHEFNNLLARIICLAEALQKPGAAPDVEAGAEAVITAAEEGAKVVRRLMAYAGSSVAVVEAVEISSALSHWRDARSPDEPIRVIDDAEGCVMVDADLFRAVLDELATNAREAGAARISVAQGQSVSVDTLVIQIEDDGHGMTPHALAHATDPFFTTHNVEQRSGLGLSMVRGAVARFGGALALSSPLGKGLIVTLQLRRALPAQLSDSERGL